MSVCVYTSKMQPKTHVANLLKLFLLFQSSEKNQCFLQAWPAQSKESGGYSVFEKW